MYYPHQLRLALAYDDGLPCMETPSRVYSRQQRGEPALVWLREPCLLEIADQGRPGDIISSLKPLLDPCLQSPRFLQSSEACGLLCQFPFAVCLLLSLAFFLASLPLALLPFLP